MLAVWTRATACAIASVLIAAIAPAQAELVADFYRGKSVRMLIGYGPGGGYDIYGRLVAEFLPRHLPGNPIIVPQNMPGAGSLRRSEVHGRSRAQGRYGAWQPFADAVT
jgi:tripartite-type tricarboxylate transporter receptor subunit TctC